MVYELRAPFDISWTATAETRNWNIGSIGVRYVPGTNDPAYPYHDAFRNDFQISASEVPPQYVEAIVRIGYWAREQLPIGRPIAIGGQVVPSLVKVTSLRVESGQLVVNFVLIKEKGFTEPLSARGWQLPQLPGPITEDLRAVDVFLQDKCLEHLMARVAKLTSSIEPSRKWVFISYANVPPDKEFAERLAKAIRELPEFQPWFFPWEVRWADDQREKMDEGITKSEAGIIVFTPYYLEHVWADYEYRGLVVKRVEERARVGIALLNGDPSNIPSSMRGLYYADFRDLSNFDKELWKIIRGLRGLPLESP